MRHRAGGKARKVLCEVLNHSRPRGSAGRRIQRVPALAAGAASANRRARAPRPEVRRRQARINTRPSAGASAFQRFGQPGGASRPQTSPSYGGNGGSGGYSAPRYSAPANSQPSSPRSAPSYSAPRSSGVGRQQRSPKFWRWRRWSLVGWRRQPGPPVKVPFWKASVSSHGPDPVQRGLGLFFERA